MILRVSFPHFPSSSRTHPVHVVHLWLNPGLLINVLFPSCSSNLSCSSNPMPGLALLLRGGGWEGGCCEPPLPVHYPSAPHMFQVFSLPWGVDSFTCTTGLVPWLPRSGQAGQVPALFLCSPWAKNGFYILRDYFLKATKKNVWWRLFVARKCKIFPTWPFSERIGQPRLWNPAHPFSPPPLMCNTRQICLSLYMCRTRSWQLALPFYWG